jgi:hypothetical protein
MTDELDVKIGTEDEKLWTGVRDEALLLIKQSENNLKIQKELLKIAEIKIKEEKIDLNSSSDNI